MAFQHSPDIPNDLINKAGLGCLEFILVGGGALVFGLLGLDPYLGALIGATPIPAYELFRRRRTPITK